jgi:hypothetical protein
VKVHHGCPRAPGATPMTYGEGLAGRFAAVKPGGVDAALDLAGSRSLAELAIVGDASRVTSAADFNGSSGSIRGRGVFGRGGCRRR